MVEEGKFNGKNYSIERCRLNIIYIKTVQIESEIHVRYEMLDVGRNFAKLETTMTSDGQQVAKAMIICQMID